MEKAMTVQDYFDRYGAMEIKDEENGELRHAFVSNPDLRMMGGVCKARDLRTDTQGTDILGLF